MNRLTLVAMFLASAAAAVPPPATLRDAALDDKIAWGIVDGLTTEVGPRLAATDAEVRARDWAIQRLNDLGFANVHVETFQMPVWKRGIETAEIVAPFPQKLAVTALGNSVSTAPQGLTADVVAFDGIEALKAADPAAVRGKIVFVNHAMAAEQDGGSYFDIGVIRHSGPSIAAQKGAAAIVIRSIGTDRGRLPHTGVQNWAAGVRPIPSAALSGADAEQLIRILVRGKPVRLHLTIGGDPAGFAQSGNVIAEVPGRDPKAGIILIGGHLDSWDLGTGAIDDGAGVAIVTAAAKRIMDAGRPLRAIRIVWFGAEEPGGFGGKAYAKAHAGEKHALVAESDTGADRIWRFAVGGNPKSPLVGRLAAVLAPLGISRGAALAYGGTDVGPLVASTRTPELALFQDMTRYFDIHHTADDTLDRIDQAQLRQNVAAWTAALAILANDSADLPPAIADKAHD